MRKVSTLAMCLFGVLATHLPAEARRHCGTGQIYRPSLGVCQGKGHHVARYARHGGRHYRHSIRYGRHAAVVVKERIQIIYRDREEVPLSGFAYDEPIRPGSLDPSPWRRQF